MTLQFIIVMITSPINDRLQRKLYYAEEERRILREQLEAGSGKKLSFTSDQRRRLATAGKLLTPDERRKCRQLVNPVTILACFRQLAAREVRQLRGQTRPSAQAQGRLPIAPRRAPQLLLPGRRLSLEATDFGTARAALYTLSCQPQVHPLRQQPPRVSSFFVDRILVQDGLTLDGAKALLKRHWHEQIRVCPGGKGVLSLQDHLVVPNVALERIGPGVHVLSDHHEADGCAS
jgi:hypothetical protein